MVTQIISGKNYGFDSQLLHIKQVRISESKLPPELILGRVLLSDDLAYFMIDTIVQLITLEVDEL